jgi:hypothetical protein
VAGAVEFAESKGLPFQAAVWRALAWATSSVAPSAPGVRLQREGGMRRSRDTGDRIVVRRRDASMKGSVADWSVLRVATDLVA